MRDRGVAPRREACGPVPAVRERGGVPASRRRASVPGLQVDGRPDLRFEVPPELVAHPALEDARGTVRRGVDAATGRVLRIAAVPGVAALAADNLAVELERRAVADVTTEVSA